MVKPRRLWEARRSGVYALLSLLFFVLTKTSTDYPRKQYWPQASLERRERMIAKMKPPEARIQRKWDSGVDEAKGKDDGSDKAIEELSKGAEDIKL